MNTQKIPFSIDKMKDAIRYETRDGRGVTQVAVFDCADGDTVAFVIDGEIMLFDSKGRYKIDSENHRDLFIITEKQIEYPCLCWVSDVSESPGECNYLRLMMEDGACRSGEHWIYSTPLTDDELKEFGLMRVEKCAN